MCFCSVGYNFFLISDFIQALIFLDESGERLINFVFSKNQLLVSFFPFFFFLASVLFLVLVFFPFYCLWGCCSMFSSSFRCKVQFSHSLSRVRLFATLRTAARQASLSITNSPSLLKLLSIESVMPSNHLIICRPLLLLPSIFPSIRVFSNESTLCIRWPKYWSFSFTISPSNDWLKFFLFPEVGH